MPAWSFGVECAFNLGVAWDGFFGDEDPDRGWGCGCACVGFEVLSRQISSSGGMERLSGEELLDWGRDWGVAL